MSPNLQTEARTPTRSADAVRVLIADNSRSVADTLALMLEIDGYEVAVAYDGLSAITVAAMLSPQCAILDLDMPGMSGLEAGREIRRLFPGVLLAALTGLATEKDRLDSKAMGFDLHLVKPATLEDIRRILGLLRQLPPAAET